MKNTVYLAIAAIALVGVVGVATASTTFAQENGVSTFVQKLAQKLGVSQDKVQTAVNEIHTENQADRLNQYKTELDAAVKNGELTQAQEDAIIAKMKELEANRQAQMDALKDKTPQERRTAMEAQRTELENWAKANNVDMKYLRPMGGRGGHGMGMGDHDGMGRSGRPNAGANPTTTPNAQ